MRVEILRVEDAAIVFGFFGSEIGDEDAIGAGLRGSGGKFFETHLEDGVVIAEEDERNLAGLADAMNEIEDAGQSRAGFQGTFGSALDRGAIGEGIAEGHAEFDDVGSSFGQCENKFVRGVESRIAGGDVGDDAEFAGGAQFREAFGDAGRIGGGRQSCFRPD